MLESMPRPAAYQPDVLHPRMAVNDEVAVGSLLVLAHAGFDERSIFQGGEAKGEILANCAQCSCGDYSFTGSGIERGAASVIRNLEAAAAAPRNAVDETATVIGPDRKMSVAETIVAGRRAEEKHVLLGRTHQTADRFWKKFAEPRATGKNVAVGGKPRMVGES